MYYHEKQIVFKKIISSGTHAILPILYIISFLGNKNTVIWVHRSYCLRCYIVSS